MIACVLLIAALSYFFILKPRLMAYEYIRGMTIAAIDIKKISNGIYNGEFVYSDVECAVRVKISDGKIENIEIVKNASNDLAKKAEKICGRVVGTQSLQVESITGASTTSKAILKSLENALLKATEK